MGETESVDHDDYAGSFRFRDRSSTNGLAVKRDTGVSINHTPEEARVPLISKPEVMYNSAKAINDSESTLLSTVDLEIPAKSSSLAEQATPL